MKTKKSSFRRPGRIKRSGPKLHGLALKIGFLVGLGSALTISLFELLVWNWSWIGTLGVSLVSAGIAYAATVFHSARRIDFIRTALKRIRKHSFEDLELPVHRDGDELTELIRQVHRTGRVVNREFDELTNIESYRRDFIGNVSHELKTPIFAIRGFAETLLEGAMEDETVRRDFVQKIIRNADRLSNLASDLSEISRLETGRKAMDLQPFDVGRWIADVVDTVESLATASDITVIYSIEPDLPAALGDALQLRQVLSNLVVNAIKYSNRDQKVVIGAKSTKSSSILFHVTDEGIGIDKEHIDRLTERFYRVDKSRSRLGGGTGLGLAIVKHVLAAHGEVLKIKSTPGKGSTFSFQLPIAEVADLDP